MRAYRNIRFREYPDVADIREQGRASHVGNVARRGVYRSKFRSAASKRTVRRYLKKRDRNLDNE